MGSAQRGQAWWCAHLLVLFVLIVSNSGIVCMRRWMGASFPADDWKIRILVAHQQQLRAQVSAGVGDTERQHGFVVASPSARRPSRGRQAAHLRRADATAVHRTKVRRTKSSPWRSEATAAATPCRQKTPSSKTFFPNQVKSSHQVAFFPGCREDLKRNQLFRARNTSPFSFSRLTHYGSTHTRGSAQKSVGCGAFFEASPRRL